MAGLSADVHTCTPFVPTTAAFSLDLVTASNRHIHFLQRVHAAGLSLQAPTLDEFRRYEQLWLPLLRSAPKDFVLVPPLDIAWLWHCHRLAPASYARACEDIIGSNHAVDCPESAFQGAEAKCMYQGVDAAGLEATQVLWRRKYPDEPFFVDTEVKHAYLSVPSVSKADDATADNGAKGRRYGKISSFDLVESCESRTSDRAGRAPTRPLCDTRPMGGWASFSFFCSGRAEIGRAHV